MPVSRKRKPEQKPGRQVTVHCDVAATVRWTFIGIAAILSVIYGAGGEHEPKLKPAALESPAKPLPPLKRITKAADVLLTGDE